MPSVRVHEDYVEEVVDAILEGRMFREIVLKELFRRTIREVGRLIEIIVSQKTDETDWWKKRLIEEYSGNTDDLIRFGGLYRKTIRNIRRRASREVCREECMISYDIIEKLLDEIEGEIPSLSIDIEFHGEKVRLSSHDAYRLLLTVISIGGAVRGGIWSEIGKRAGPRILKRIFGELGIAESRLLNPNFYYTLEVVNEGRETDAEIFYMGKRVHRVEIKLLGIGNPEIGNEAIARRCDIFLVDDLTTLMKEQAKQHGVRVILLKNALKELYELFVQEGLPVKKP